jgi:tetratricopeptide (TPR) repeat protein
MPSPAVYLFCVLRRSFAASATAICLLFLAVLVTIPESAFAQASDAEYTTEQQKLNEKGVRAIISKDYVLAIAVLEESAAIGELNVTYLNLGRAYQKLGDCQAARAAYEKAKAAPKVRAPSPDVVAKKLEEYTDELATVCEAKKDAEMAETGEPADKADKADTESSEASAKADESAAGATPKDTQIEPISPEEPSTNSAWAWATAGSGVALMGAGVGALLWADSLRSEVSGAAQNEQGYITSMSRSQALENQSRAETLDAVGIGMTIGGALLTTGGVYLLLTDDTEADTSVELRTGTDRVGLVWTKQF